MKRTLLFIFTLTFLISCNIEINKETLTGKWEITNYEATNENFPYLTEGVKAVYISNVYNLAENGDYQILQENNPHIGKWSINSEKLLKLTDTSGSVRTLSVIKLKKNMLQLLDKERFALTGIIITLKRKD